jgi:exonuclease I
MKKIKDVFEADCLCFNFSDVCDKRFKKLLPEHRKELFFAKLSFEKYEKLRETNKKKALEHLKEYENFYFKEWRKNYDFDVDLYLL